MTDNAGNFLDFLEGIYGRAATEQIAKLSGLKEEDIRTASEAFVHAFLSSLMQARSSKASVGGDASPSFANFWPKEMQEAMQTFVNQSAETAKQFAPSDSSDNQAFPFNVFAKQQGQMETLYQVFMGQVAQAKLMDDVAQATGISHNQLKTLFPILTTYGLMPLMPPSLDDPAGWVDYLGDMGRQRFREASRDLDAMPNPVSAAFDGLLSGLYPSVASETGTSEPSPQETAEAKLGELQEASLALQTNYIKSLNSLFEGYQPGKDQGKDDD